jgi:hypothetical protein
MTKILQFKLPSLAASGNTGFEIPVKREPEPETRRKEPIILSIMPEQAFPVGHRDLRPILQRDGLILLSWAIWEDAAGDGSFQRRYIVTWATSLGKARHYATNLVSESGLSEAIPERRADTYFYRGLQGNSFVLDYLRNKDIADYVYLAAPFDLDKETIPGFIRVLKALGSTVDFSMDYTLGGQRAKKSEARKYLDGLASTQVG